MRLAEKTSAAGGLWLKPFRPHLLQDFFAPMIVDAVECLGASLDLSLIGIKKVPGGSVTECMLVKGVAFKRTFSYAGFEQQVGS